MTPMAFSADGFIYVVANNGINQYAIEADGQLQPISPPLYSALLMPNYTYARGHQYTAVDPSGRYVFDGSSQSRPSLLMSYQVTADGTLAATSSRSFDEGWGNGSLAVDPRGRFLYRLDDSASTLVQYRINPDKSLRLLSPAAVPAGFLPRDMVVDGSGRFVYVVTGGKVLVFAIGAGGTLSPRPPYPSPEGTNFSLTAHPFKPVLYAASDQILAMRPSKRPGSMESINAVLQFHIQPDGSLTPFNPPAIAAEVNPWSVALDAAGRHAYVPNEGSNTISQYRIDADGALIALTPATAVTGNGPTRAVVSASGRFAYVLNTRDDTISEYRVNSDGTLQPLDPQTVPTGRFPSGIINAAPHQ